MNQLPAEARTRIVALGAAPDPAAIDDPLLTPRERQRCAAFRREIDAARHATGRRLAREAIHELLGVGAETVRLAVDADGPTRGRPRPTVDGSAVDAHVSIAHAGQVVLVAAARVPCGIDVELVEGLASLLGNDVVFSPGELGVLATAGRESLALATSWWTAKEAALKALGIGLRDDPATLDARSGVITIDDPGASTRWRITDIPAPAGHRASLATPQDVEIEVFQT